MTCDSWGSHTHHKRVFWSDFTWEERVEPWRWWRRCLRGQWSPFATARCSDGSLVPIRSRPPSQTVRRGEVPQPLSPEKDRTLFVQGFYFQVKNLVIGWWSWGLYHPQLITPSLTITLSPLHSLHPKQHLVASTSTGNIVYVRLPALFPVVSLILSAFLSAVAAIQKGTASHSDMRWVNLSTFMTADKHLCGCPSWENSLFGVGPKEIGLRGNQFLFSTSGAVLH